MPQVQQSLNESQQQLQQADALIKTLMQKVQELSSKDQLERLKLFVQMKIAAASDMAGIIESEVKAGQTAARDVLLAQLEMILKQLDTPPQEDGGLGSTAATPQSQNQSAPQQVSSATPAGMPPPGSGVPPSNGLPGGV